MDIELNTVITTNDDYGHLPTAEEFEASISVTPYIMKEWSDPIYQCPKCSGGMCKNLMEICTSIPPKYRYSCNKCGYTDYQYV